MKKGDILLVRFPFTDLSSEKLRPALVLTPENQEGDAILAFITTQVTSELIDDVYISQDDKYFGQTGLKTNSLIKIHKITTLNKKILAGKIGELSSEKMREVDKKLKSLLGFT